MLVQGDLILRHSLNIILELHCEELFEIFDRCLLFLFFEFRPLLLGGVKVILLARFLGLHFELIIGIFGDCLVGLSFKELPGPTLLLLEEYIVVPFNVFFQIFEISFEFKTVPASNFGVFHGLTGHFLLKRRFIHGRF